jgi:hypothetical protein
MGFVTSASRSRSTSWSSTFCGAFLAATRLCGHSSRTSSRHPPSCRSVMPLPWRSSPGATTHLPRPHLRPLLVHLSLPHHRLPPRRRPLSFVLLPPGRAGWGGRGGRRGCRGRSGGGRGRCALADRVPPVVRAYLHAALPGSGRGPRPQHQPAAMVTSAASYVPTGTPPPPPSSSWPGGVGSGCPGAVL